jgi:hypothetical protein
MAARRAGGPVLASLKSKPGMARMFSGINAEIDRRRAIAGMALAGDR